MKTKCKVCTVMCDISRGNELRACAFEHNGDENICPFDGRYLDLSEHDKQIRADVIDEFAELLIKRCWSKIYGDLEYVSEEEIKEVASQLKGQK